LSYAPTVGNLTGGMICDCSISQAQGHGSGERRLRGK